MNPLPSRQLVTNPALPVSLPNVPSFDQMGFRPRKLMPEVGKDFPLMNGMNSMPGQSSASASSGPQIAIVERGNTLGPGMMQAQQHPPGSLGQYQQMQQQNGQNSVQQLQSQDGEKDKEGLTESQQLTAIFRPDADGEWKEKLRLSHEAEQARMGRSDGNMSNGAWDRRPREDDEEGKEEEGEVEDDESSVLGEGDGTKVWKAKRTLRKSVG